MEKEYITLPLIQDELNNRIAPRLQKVCKDAMAEMTKLELSKFTCGRLSCLAERISQDLAALSSCLNDYLFLSPQENSTNPEWAERASENLKATNCDN